VECGLNTGCVKIYVDSEEMSLRYHKIYFSTLTTSKIIFSLANPLLSNKDLKFLNISRKNQQYGYAYPTGEGGGSQALPEKYLDNPILLRGCFVLAVPDRCYTANNGLTYCWCSTKDLCTSLIQSSNLSLSLCISIATLIFHSLIKSFLLKVPWEILL